MKLRPTCCLHFSMQSKGIHYRLSSYKGPTDPISSRSRRAFQNKSLYYWIFVIGSFNTRFTLKLYHWIWKHQPPRSALRLCLCICIHFTDGTAQVGHWAPDDSGPQRHCVVCVTVVTPLPPNTYIIILFVRQNINLR